MERRLFKSRSDVFLPYKPAPGYIILKMDNYFNGEVSTDK